MTARDDAITALARATDADILGVEMIIDGGVVQAVRKNLAAEDVHLFAGGQFGDDGLRAEGLRITVRQDLLSYEPLVGMEMEIDGINYTVRAVAKIGLNRRITLIRFTT